jgi:hypothetical protein
VVRRSWLSFVLDFRRLNNDNIVDGNPFTFDFIGDFIEISVSLEWAVVSATLENELLSLELSNEQKSLVIY